MADRLRQTTTRMGYGAATDDKHSKDELNEDLLDNVHLAGARFDRMLKRLAGYVSDASIFRKAALDRLASPERLDERLGLPGYPVALLVALAALLASVAVFTLWLLLAR